MVAPPKPPRPSKTSCGAVGGSPGWLGRLRELAGDGEPDPTDLLCAVAQAKVLEQAASDDPKKRRGRYATGQTFCRDRYWESNLAAGRELLAEDSGEDVGVPLPIGDVAPPQTDEERAWWAREVKVVDLATASRELASRRFIAEAAQ